MPIDPLIEAIVANPDDDAPRLVWADREGGERGELVVVQCALAKAPTPALQAREKKLLARIPPPFGAKEARYRRGFVEHLKVEFRVLRERVEEIFERCPALRSLDIHALTPEMFRDGPSSEGVWEYTAKAVLAFFPRLPMARLTRLGAAPSVVEQSDWSGPSSWEPHGDDFAALVADAPALQGLEELELWGSGLTTKALPHLERLGKLTTLRLWDHYLDGAALAALLRAVPARLVLRQGQAGDDRKAVAALPKELPRSRGGRGMSDPLLDAIVANPDDDAPRLVWADREGGERGELVVLECALDYRGLSDETRMKYIARHKEILAAHGDAWTGGFGKHAHCTFSRGFVEHIHVDSLALFVERIDRVEECAPLLSSLQFQGITDDEDRTWPTAVARLERVVRRFDDRLRSLRFPVRVDGVYHGDVFLQDVIANAGLGRSLEQLELMSSGVGRFGVKDLALLPRLTKLTLSEHLLDGAAIVTLLESLPNLKMLSLMYGLNRMQPADVERIIACPRSKELWDLSLHQTPIGEDSRERLRGALGSRVKF